LGIVKLLEESKYEIHIFGLIDNTMTTMEQELTRDDFREAVFARDGYMCVICGKPAIDAHHILERRLFKPIGGGYKINNGASLCEKHHLEAEMTTLTCDDIRRAAGIETIVLPLHFYEDAEYDKWGNEILKNGTRLKGELFEDESVQKILERGGVLGEFTNRVKYNRTFHLPWSPGMNRDDRMMTDVNIFKGQRIMIMEKMDGENTTMMSDIIHARSLDTDSHPSRNWVKNLWAQIGYQLPPDWRLCGENLYAKHAIHYSKANANALRSFFLAFSLWNEKNICLDWDETLEWFELLGLETPTIFYDGIYDHDFIEELNKKMETNPNTIEGYVIRLTREYHYSEFRDVCGKYVRKNHVQNNHGHWSTQKIIKNELI
jgi:hypothetical protein